MYFEQMKKYMNEGSALWQVTIITTDGSTPAKPGMKMIIPLKSEIFGNLGGGEMEHAIIDYIRERQPTSSQVLAFKLNNSGIFTEVDKDVNVDISTNMICGGSVEVFIEPLFKKDKLYIIGAGHCGKALGHIAKLCGFYVVMIDNRESSLVKEGVGIVDRCVHIAYHDIGSVIEFDDFAYIVIMTHGHIHDKEVLEYCIRSKYKYLGMIGSNNKVQQTFANMLSNGYTREELEKVHAPIGMRISSHTPYEIAVSITAELISIRNKDKTSKPIPQEMVNCNNNAN